jgi:plastocyanin
VFVRRAAGACLAATALLAAFTGQALAATKTVSAGPNAKLAPELAINDFFRRTVTIHQGDSVKWIFRGFHDVVLPAKGHKAPPFFAADPVAKIEGFADTAGAPFWFNGLPRQNIDPRSAFPAGSKTYDGTRLTGSGIPQGDTAAPYKLQFTKTGVFTYYCTIHTGMKARVKVLPKSARIPTAAQDAKAAKQQLSVALKQAKKLAAPNIPAATVHGGSDRGAVNYLKFFPGSVTIKAGQSVVFSVPGSQEPHTFSFGTDAYLKDIVAKQITPVPGAGGPPTLVFDPRALLPSDPPGALPAYTGQNHGDGFLSTGVLGKGTPGGTRASVTFANPGTYGFICLIHPEMHGTVVVQ